RFCQALAADSTVANPAEADRLCESLFLASGARERDDNLSFVRERLLRSHEDRASLLDLYGEIRSGRPVADDEINPLVPVLKLAGVVRSEPARRRVASSRGRARCLRVRNRIYTRAFD